MHSHTEVGVVTAHPLSMAYKAVLTILKTWRYAKKRGLPTNKWYGVYEAKSEILLAQCGCLPGAETRARQISVALNTTHVLD